MTDIIINWLKTFPQFEEKLKSNTIEEIFSNGYQFGRLFHSNKLFQDMKLLKNLETKEDSLNNYYFLRKTFLKIGIDLIDDDINDLISKKLHKAELYLFKIKQYLLLHKIQFNEIVEKMDAEKKTKYKDEMSQKIQKKNLLNRYQSAKKRTNCINLEEKKTRLQSATLPQINKIQYDVKKMKKIESSGNNKSIINNITEEQKEQKILENKQMQAVINDIQIFENIHMKKGQKTLKKNPWDEINYIYDKDALFNKDKNNDKEKKIDSILDKLNKENKKENIDNKNNKKNIEFSFATMNSAFNNYNKFVSDNQKQYFNRQSLEKGLSLMGLTATKLFPSILKIKGNKIPSELIMKSINDKSKERKKENLRELFYEESGINTKSKKHPSSAIRIGKASISKNILNKQDNIKKSEFKIKSKRAMTAKYQKKLKKNYINSKESDDRLNLYIKDKSNINENKDKDIKDKKDDRNTNKIKKGKNKEFREGLTKIEESDKLISQNSFPSSVISSAKDEKSIISVKNKLKLEKEIKEINKNKNILEYKTEEERANFIEKKKKEYITDTKNIKEIISSIIDITEAYYDYQVNTGEEFIDLDLWNKITYNFIINKSIIKKKKEKKVSLEEEEGNINFDMMNEKIDEKFAKNYGINELNEMKNYLGLIGKKYDKNKNNLYTKKFGIKAPLLEINDIMGDEIEILFKKALAEGKDAKDEEDEEEIKKTGKIKYRPSKEEEEIIEPIYSGNAINEFIFTNLISEVIKFGYDKDKNNAQIKDFSLKKEIINDSNNINKIEKEEENISYKEILNSIPIKLSFIGLMNSEIKLIIKNSLSKYPKLKIYNPIELLTELRLKKKKIDEPIDELNLKKNQIDQLKKEKNILSEEIKDYLDLIENKNNLTDDEICIKILQSFIKKDFEKKNVEDIRKEITVKRENIKAINDKMNIIIEEQNQGKKPNPRELQNLQQQLDKIYFDSIIGFVLINFPNNVNQSILLEKYMMDFIQPSEKGVSDFDIINDKLLFICDKEIKQQKIIKFESCLDKMVLLFCDINKLITSENLTTQLQNNKFNQTNQANQVNENETSEKNNKEQIENYKNNFNEMEEFYQNFNLKIDKYDYYEGIEEEHNLLLNNNNINMNSNAFIQRDKIFLEKLKSSLIIYEDKIVPNIINNTILADESYDEVLEEVANLEDKESSRKVSGDSSLKMKTLQKKDSSNSSSILKNNEISKISPEKDKEKDKDKEKPKNINNIPKLKQKKISLALISEEERYIMYKMWKELIEHYNYYIYRIFYREKNIERKKTEQQLVELQNNFIQFLANPEEQIILVNQFLDKYKCLRDNFCKNKSMNNEIYKFIEKNFNKDLDELNDSLWIVAKIRKNQAFDEIKKIKNDNYIAKELKICYFKLERLIILESQKLIVIVNIFIRYFALSFNSKNIINNIIPQFILQDNTLSEELLLNLETEPLYLQTDKKIIYPRANLLYKNTFKLLIKIYVFLDNFYNSINTRDKKGNLGASLYKSPKMKKAKSKGISTPSSSKSNIRLNYNLKLDMQNQIRFAIKTHIKKYKNKVYNLYMNTLEDLSKIYCPFNEVIKLMDNWIILSMELQTNNINKTINLLKQKYSNVNKILGTDNELYNFEFKGINPEDFTLFNENRFLGLNNIISSEKNQIQTDEDFYKIYESIKEFDLLAKLRNAEIQKGIITQEKFEEIFFKNCLFDNIDKFPNVFKNIDYHNISNYLSHFVVLSSDFSSKKDDIHPQKLLYTNDILITLILSCVLIDKDKIKEKEKSIESCYINEETFMENNFGFEEGLYINDKDDKNKKIKLFLFEICKTCGDIPEINIKKFLELLLLKKIKNVNPDDIGKYFDLFFK